MLVLSELLLKVEVFISDISMKCKIFLKHGGVPDSKFNLKQLRVGTLVEKEHSNNLCISKQIAKAHLVEDKDYYKKLKKFKL